MCGVRFRLKTFCITQFLDFEEGDESWPMLKRFGRLNANGNDGYPDTDYDETGRDDGGYNPPRKVG